MAVGPPVVNPNTRDFIENTMKPFSRRLIEAQVRYQPIIDAGVLAADDSSVEGRKTRQLAEQASAVCQKVRDEVTHDIINAVMPWVQAQIARECSHMPAGADAAEIRSHMMMATWRIAAKYDPYCPQSWPTALKQCLRGAWLEAYRSVDFITRKHRALNNQWRAAVEREVQRLQRELTPDEKLQIAHEIIPMHESGSVVRHEAWVRAVVHQTPPPPLGGNAIEWETTGAATDYLADPAEVVCDVQLAGNFSAWLDKLPERDQEAVRLAMTENRPVNAKVRARIGRYLPELAAIIRSDYDEDFEAALA